MPGTPDISSRRTQYCQARLPGRPCVSLSPGCPCGIRRHRRHIPGMRPAILPCWAAVPPSLSPDLRRRRDARSLGRIMSGGYPFHPRRAEGKPRMGPRPKPRPMLLLALCRGWRCEGFVMSTSGGYVPEKGGVSLIGAKQSSPVPRSRLIWRRPELLWGGSSAECDRCLVHPA